MTEAEQIQETEHKRIKKRKFLVPIISILAVMAGIYLFHESHFQSTDDAYVEADIIQVTPKVSGHIVESYITDNMHIKEGDLVAKIDDEMYKAKYEQAKANYERAILNQKNAKANLKSVDSQIKLAKTDLERYKKLYEEGAVSKQTLDKAQTNYDNVLASQIRAKEDIFAKGNNVADADLKALKAIMDQAKLNLEYTNVLSPNTGVVTNRRIEKGSFKTKKFRIENFIRNYRTRKRIFMQLRTRAIFTRMRAEKARCFLFRGFLKAGWTN